jgi:Domain of Unknown Function (DUF1080)
MKRYLVLTMTFVICAGTSPAGPGEPNLFSDGLSAFKGPIGEWEEVGSVVMDPDNPKKLQAKPGKGVWFNGPKGRTKNLFTKKNHGDVEVSFEFLIPKGSNSGVKFHGHYEIQIMDSFGAKELSGDSCGGVYPRAEAKPKYHHIDKGIAPRVNACKPAGEWQSMTIAFQAPRFDAKGKKIANARLLKVVFNGQVIHENQELLTPTGDRWPNPEMAEGPLMIQADHGPVAFRNLTMRPLAAK